MMLSKAMKSYRLFSLTQNRLLRFASAPYVPCLLHTASGCPPSLLCSPPGLPQSAADSPLSLAASNLLSGIPMQRTDSCLSFTRSLTLPVPGL